MLRCPECGRDNGVVIKVQQETWVQKDNGGYHYRPVGPRGWKSDSHAYCMQCRYEGTVEDFTHEE